MVDMMLDFMLGPMRAIGDFYFEYQMIFNPIIIGIAFYQIIRNNKQDREVTGDK